MFRLIVLSALFACSFGAAVPKGLLPLLGSRIVGGKDADIRNFPYTVSLRNNGMHRCGGVIYKNNVIITTAQCVSGISPSNLAVVAGSTYLDVPGVARRVSKIIEHKDYQPGNLYNNIALLILESSLSGSNIRAINIAASDSSVASGTQATCVGWGALKESGGAENRLQYVQVSVVSNADCTKYYGYGTINNSMMCAGEVKGGKDACQGDTGGPLVVAGTLVGIVSWGIGCARPEYPTIYTKIGSFRSWIIETSK